MPHNYSAKHFRPAWSMRQKGPLELQQLGPRSQFPRGSLEGVIGLEWIGHHLTLILSQLVS